MKRALFAILLGMAIGACAFAQAEEMTLTFGGDCVLGTREEWKQDADTFDTRVAKSGLDYPFANLLPVFEKDDMTLVNLECVLQANNAGHNYRKQHTFRGEPGYAEMLALASVEQVNLANNHTVDYGASGMKATKAALDAAGVAYSGAKALYVWEHNGRKIGFGGCREATFLKNKPTVYRDIQKLKKLGCDVIVYACHWGKEYSPTHNQTQERMARYAVNSGADIVVGTHPHVVQGAQALQSSDGTHTALVLYSLGNLVFGGTHEMKTFDGALAQVTLRFEENGGYLGAALRFIPVLTSGDIPRNDFRPVLAQGDDAKRIMSLIAADATPNAAEGLWVEK